MKGKQPTESIRKKANRKKNWLTMLKGEKERQKDCGRR